MEEWRPIKKSRGQYEASSLGRIRNARTGRIRSPHKQSKNNNALVLSLHGFMKGRSYTVAKLVAMAFYPDEEGRVYHLNGNIQDNRPENLRIQE